MPAVSWVEIAPDDGTNFYNIERPKYYDLTGYGRKPVTMIHRITVAGLEPGTKYRYRIMMKGVLSENNRASIIYTEGYGLDLNKYPTYVKTLSHNYDKLHFAVVNDMHEGDSVFRRLFKDSKGKYDFVVFNGDMTSTINTGNDIIKNYLRSAAELFASDTPFYMARGNHEYRGNNATKYLDYFDTGTGKTYYTFKYGKFFFIVLDSGEDKADSDIRNLDIMITEPYIKEEALWLKKVVQSEDFRNAETRIVFSHIQPDPKSWHGNLMVSEYFVPVLNKAGIDLMLCGHIHKYRYYKPGTTNANFPVVCNKNRELMVTDVNADKITLNMFDADGKQTHSLEFKTKQYKK
jgi:Icc-related predicted phosphoesterase